MLNHGLECNKSVLSELIYHTRQWFNRHWFYVWRQSVV